jgi:hypothetical protein
MNIQCFTVVQYADRDSCGNGDCEHMFGAYYDDKLVASWYEPGKRVFEGKTCRELQSRRVKAATGTGAIIKFLDWLQTGKPDTWLMESEAQGRIPSGFYKTAECHRGI